MCILKSQLYNHLVYYISLARWLLRIVFPLFLFSCRTLIRTRRTRSAEPSKSRRHLWNIKWRVQVAGTMSNCNTLKHTATRWNTLQHAETHCNTLQDTATHFDSPNDESESKVQCLTAIHSIALQHTATHKMTGTTSHCNTLQHTAYCNTLKHTKRRVGFTGTISHCYTLKRICNTLQHAATRQQTSPDELQVQCWFVCQ